MNKTPAGLDFFARFRLPCALRANQAGALCFASKRANVAQNRYDTAFWLHRGGRLRRLALPRGAAACWWRDEDTLLVAGPGARADRRRAGQGLPFTQLHTLRLDEDGTPAEAAPPIGLHLEVEDAAPLADGRLLLVARWDPAVDDALARAGQDKDKAAAQLAQTAAMTTVTQLPMWENGGGFIGRARRRLYLWDGTAARPLTDEETEVEGLRVLPGGGGALFLAASWRQVAPVGNAVYHWDAATGALNRWSMAGQGPFRAQWVLPCTDEVAVVAGSDMAAHGLNQNPAFYRVQVAGGQARLLHPGGEAGAWPMVNTDLNTGGGAPCFVAGRALWPATVGSTAQLMALAVDSGALAPCTAVDGAVFAAAPGPDETLYLQAMVGQAGPEVYQLALEPGPKDEPAGQWRAITAFNRAATRQAALAVPRPFATRHADGTEVCGYVLPPVDTPTAAAATTAGGHPPATRQTRAAPPSTAGTTTSWPAASVPVIFSIHGGPKTAFGGVLFHEMQHWAGQGFAVVYCNPRGSDGQGDAFADIRGHYGQQDAEDILAFLDAVLAAHPWMDPARVGVAGGSYGGFMVNWLIGHTRRFAAAASQRGIASWPSMALLSDIGYYFAPDQTGGDVWNAPEAYHRQSPLATAPAATTPTLFIHSDEDYRCPLAEGMQMYAALRLHGVPARLCIFHGENHELSRSGRPQNRIRRLREMTDWFRRYLTGDKMAPPAGQ